MEIYLDSAATSRPAETCIQAMEHAMRGCFGNPSSLHGAGLAAERCMNNARKQIAAALHCESADLTFTSGATESNHLALRGAAAVYGRRKKRVVTTAVEHACVRGAFDILEEQGFEVIRVSPDADGILTAEHMLDAVNENTCLVSMMLVNNETGTILPVAETFAIIKRKYPQIITHTDAVQGFLKIPFVPEKLGADLLTVSGHKVHAAKGIGALYHKRGVRLAPLMKGGEQENGLRPGTESVPLIAGFGAAAAELLPTLHERYVHAEALRRHLLERLSEAEDIAVNSRPDGSPYIVSIAVKGLRSETVLHYLSERGIFVSSGSACAKGRQSGVLQAFGIRPDTADSTLRVSFCAENTAEEIDQLCDALRAAQKSLVHKH